MYVYNVFCYFVTGNNSRVPMQKKREKWPQEHSILICLHLVFFFFFISETENFITCLDFRYKATHKKTVKIGVRPQAEI